MNNTKDIELIQRFRTGILNEQEIESFNERLQSDTAFKNLHDDFFESEKILKLKELFAVKSELDKFDYSDDADEEDGSKSKIILGLSLLALLGVGGWYYSTNAISNEKEIKSGISSANVQDLRVVSIKDNSALQKQLVQKTPQPDNLIKEEVDNANGLGNLISDTISLNSPNPQNEIDLSASVVEPQKELHLDCNEKPLVDFYSVGSCEGEANGAVIIKGIKGNYGPYKVIKDSNIESVITKAEYRGLEPGKYQFYFIDSRSCKTSVSVKVDKLACIKDEVHENAVLDNYLIYLPGQSWKIPVKGKRAKVEIKDQKGNLIFDKEVVKYENDEWGGMDLNSKEVEPGVYFFQITEEGEKEKTGSITIMK